MGRDKPKKYSKMGYFEKEQWKKDEARKRGIEGIKYTDSRGNMQTRVNEKALKESVRNDFDYRTSASHMDGAKGNGKFNDFTKYQRGAVKLHKQAGNGGEFSSTEDITTVTNNLVKDYRRGIQDQIDGMSSSGDDEQTAEAITPTDYSESEDTIKAREIVKNWQDSNLGGDVYGTNTSSSPATSAFNKEKKRAVTTNVDEFVANYKNDVYKGANMRPDIPI